MPLTGQLDTLHYALKNQIGNGFFYMMFEYANKPGVMREGIYKFNVRNKSKSYIDGKPITTSGNKPTMPPEKGICVCEFSNREYIEKQAELNGRATWTPHDYTNVSFDKIRLLKYRGVLRAVQIHENSAYRVTNLIAVPQEFEQSAKLLIRSGINFDMVGISEISKH